MPFVSDAATGAFASSPYVQPSIVTVPTPVESAMVNASSSDASL